MTLRWMALAIVIAMLAGTPAIIVPAQIVGSEPAEALDGESLAPHVPRSVKRGESPHRVHRRVAHDQPHGLAASRVVVDDMRRVVLVDPPGPPAHEPRVCPPRVLARGPPHG